MGEDIQKQILREKEAAHDETIWGKPANDIITGIGNNSGVKPQRAIWEMVQNARDVALDSKVDITFERHHDCFIFQHNGIPFTNSTLEALILQSSSKARNDSIQVGQYGTGFLTTHKLGLKFLLSGSLQLLEDRRLFHNFSDFLVDRSSTDKKQIIDNLKKQIAETEEWANNPSIVEKPSPLTTFRYIQEHEVERENAKDAFKASSAIAPYVIALNPSVNSISFIDAVDDCKESYIIKRKEIIKEFDLYRVVKITIEKCTTKSDDFIVLMLQSKKVAVEGSEEPKVTIILPFKEKDGRYVAFDLSKDVPNLFIYLPLLGTEQWGLNYIFHSPLFTCDKDTRDSLRFVGNGQNNDADAERNKEIIQLADSIISHYIDENLSDIQDGKYLAKVAFNSYSGNEALNNYYRHLHRSWVEKYESLPFVTTDNCRIITSQAKVLDKELCDACLGNEKLLAAVYDVMCAKYGAVVLPIKTELLFWSKTLLRWYETEVDNPHLVHLGDIINYIDENNLSAIGLDNLWQIDNYVANSKQTGLFAEKKLLPTKNGELRIKEELLNPIISDTVLLNILDNLLPKDINSFIDVCFTSFENVTIKEYGHNQVKDSMRLLVSELSDLQKGHEAYRKNELEGNVDLSKYEESKLSDSHINALMEFYAYVANSEGAAFQNKMLHILADFYEIDLNPGNADAKDIYDWRTVAPLLIKDALFRFTLMDNEKQTEYAEWVSEMVKALYNYSDYRTYLDKYKVYPNEVGEYCYSKNIYKSVNIPDDLVKLYDKVVNDDDVEKSIRNKLLNGTFNDYFVEIATVEGSSLSCEIMKKIKSEEFPTISSNKWKQEILDIIAKQDKNDYWVSLFGEINSSKANILLSVIEDKEKKDSIFSLIRVNDTKKLKALAEVAEDDNFIRIIELGKGALRDEMNVEADFEYKKKLGEYVEKLIYNELSDKLNACSHVLEVISKQDGQDIVVQLNGAVIYYIEVKSRWAPKDSVLMSASQFRTSVEKKGHYALCEVDMIDYDKTNVEKHEYPNISETIDRILAVTNIGVLNEALKDSLNQESDQVHVGGDYKVIVPQAVWKEHGIQFNELVQEIKKKVEEKL